MVVVLCDASSVADRILLRFELRHVPTLGSWNGHLICCATSDFKNIPRMKNGLTSLCLSIGYGYEAMVGDPR